MTPQELQGQHDHYQCDATRPRDGGMAVVFPAASRTGPQVAVKWARGPGIPAETLRSEHDLLASLHGRGAAGWLVGLRDHGEDAQGLPFVVLDWYEQTLSSWLRRDHPVVDRLRAAELCCRAVDALHRCTDDITQVLVHRDLKPSNFLMETTPDGRPVRLVLADLGIAREGGLFDHRTQLAAFTQDFAPLEQMLQRRSAPDTRLDMHALGVTVYQILADRVPTSVRNRTSLLTDAGERALRILQEPHEVEPGVLANLRSLPLRELVRLDEAHALEKPDEVRLLDALTGHVDDEDLLVKARRAVADVLIPSLRDVLHPDPDRRATEARRLVAALVSVRDVLAGVSGHRAPGKVESAEETLRDEPSGAMPITLVERSEAVALRTRLVVVLLVVGAAVIGLGATWKPERPLVAPDPSPPSPATQPVAAPAEQVPPPPAGLPTDPPPPKEPPEGPAGTRPAEPTRKPGEVTETKLDPPVIVDPPPPPPPPKPVPVVPPPNIQITISFPALHDAPIFVDDHEINGPFRPTRAGTHTVEIRPKDMDPVPPVRLTLRVEDGEWLITGAGKTDHPAQGRSFTLIVRPDGRASLAP